MKKAIGDNLIPKGWTLENGLALIHKAGFDGAELWLGDKPWFQMSTTDAGGAETWRRKVEDAGLVVSNVSNTLDWEIPISSAILRYAKKQNSTSYVSLRPRRFWAREISRRRPGHGRDSLQ